MGTSWRSPQKNPRPSGAWTGTLWIRLVLENGCRFSVEEVVHHDDVFSVVIRPRSDIAGYDFHSCNASVAKDNADEGQVSVARRGRRIAGEKQLAARAVVLDQSAGETVACPVFGALPSGESTSVKTTPKPVEVAGVLPLLPGTENSIWVTLLPIGENSRCGLNAWKIVA